MIFYVDTYIHICVNMSQQTPFKNPETSTKVYLLDPSVEMELVCGSLC